NRKRKNVLFSDEFSDYEKDGKKGQKKNQNDYDRWPKKGKGAAAAKKALKEAPQSTSQNSMPSGKNSKRAEKI
ncbi:hypothetical protein C0992_011439, partial [Termitomyces sp. T32_za158]